MEGHNTDDLFKKMLENPPPMRPDLDALEVMNQRLEEVGKEPKRPLWWLVPLLLLPLLLGSFFVYNKYQTAQNIIEELNTQLSDFQKNTKKEIFTKKVTIYEYDTIVRTVYKDVFVNRIREEIFETSTNKSGIFTDDSPYHFAIKKLNLAFTNKSNTFDNSSIQPSQLELLRNGKVLSLGQMERFLDNGNDIGRENYERTNKDYAKVNALNKLTFFNNRFFYEHPLPNSDHFLNLTPPSNIDKINPLWALVPTGLQVGFNWSPIGKNKTILGNNNVKAIGLIGEVEFTKNTRLQVGLDYLSTALKAETQEEFSLFPPATPDAPSDILSELYGDFIYLQVPLTFKYIFQPDKRWKPSVGIGIIARLPLKEQLTYEFFNGQIGEYKQLQDLTSDGFAINNLRGMIGIEYNLYKGYSIQAEGYYNHQYGTTTNPYFKLRYGGVNIGLKYKF